MKEINRLTKLKVKEVSLVDNPAIREVFYIIKSQGGKSVEKTDKVVVKTIEEIEKEFNDYEATLITKVGEAKSAIESLLEKELAEDLRGAVAKVMDALSEIGKMKHPGMMIGTPHHDDEEEKKKKEQKQLEEQKKSLDAGIVTIDEMRNANKVVLEQTQKSMTDVQQAISGLSQGMQVLCETMTASFGDKFVEKIEKAMTGVGTKLEELAAELDKKAGKDEVPIRKGMTNNKGERPTEEAVTKNPIAEVVKSERYQKATPREQLDMVLPKFTGE